MAVAWFKSAWTDAVNVQKSGVKDGLRDYVAAYHTATELRALTADGLRCAVINGRAFLYDGADTTTADDGEVCIVSSDGKRFKRSLNRPKVFVATGQSHFVDSPALAWTPAKNAYLWNFSGVDGNIGTAFEALPDDEINMTWAAVSAYAAKNPDTPVFLINVSFGGQAIAHWMTGASAPDVYVNLKNNVEAALAVLGLDTIDAMMWGQGPSDAAAPTNYVANFETVMTRFKGETWFPLYTPVLVFGVPSDAIAGTPFGNFNNYLQQCVGAEPDNRLFVYSAVFPQTYWDAGSSYIHPTATGHSLIGPLANNVFTRGVGRQVLPGIVTDAPTGWAGFGIVDPFHQVDVEDDNPDRGIVARVRNRQTVGPTGAMIGFSQAGVAQWAAGLDSGGRYCWYVNRTASADGTLLGCIDGNGRFLLGGGTSALALSGVSTNQMQVQSNASTGITAIRFDAAVGGPQFHFLKSRNTTLGSHTIVNSGDTLGDLWWGGSDGAKFVQAIRIRGRVAGTPGTDDMPGSLDIDLTPDGSAAVANLCTFNGVVGSFDLASGKVMRVNSTQVVAARKTGWGTATGTATRTTFATGSVTLSELAERVKALIDDLHGTAGHGLIGT